MTTAPLTPEEIRSRPLISAAEYIATTGVDRSTYYRLVRNGSLDTVKVGGRRLVKTAPLVHAWGLDETRADA